MGVISDIIATLFPKPKTAKPTAVSPSTNNYYVYVTPGGKRYHIRPDCPTLSRAKRKPVRMKYADAKAAKYTPCETCSAIHEDEW